MSDISEVTIATRFTRLNQLILGKSNGNLPKKYLAHRDSLLDVLFALYAECNGEQLRKNKHVSSFVEKFKSIMGELKSLRLSLQDFEQKKVIGRGHFGEVQLVREKTSGDVYAMKVLHKQETLSQQAVAFFEEERDIMAKSSSPWLTKLQYAFQDNQNLYLVMEFHPGGDMISLLEKYDNVLPDEMCLFYLAELVLAINSLHAMGYVHRDIKPANILIDRTGHIKLADFGSASKLNGQKQVMSSMPVGTPDYVAPEVLTAMNGGSVSCKSYGVECDWWSLGIMAYEMVFGSTPFADEKVLVTYNNIMNFKNSLNFPPEENEVPKDLIDLIKNLLTEPMKRLDYDQLIVHPLFHNINWNDIRHIRPPFVPTVMSVDDTSNFDEFEPENRMFLSELNSKKEFSGKNLPFVGFTYTSTVEAPFDKSSSSESFSSGVLSPTCSLTEADSNVRRSRMQAMEREIAHMVKLESTLREEIVKLEEGGKESREALLAENKRLEETLARRDEEIKHMKQVLAIEHKHHQLTEKKAQLNEKKAIYMVRCLKAKRRESTSRLIAKSKELNTSRDSDSLSLEEKLADAEAKVQELNNERADLIEDLHDTKYLLLECQQKLKEQENILSAGSENTSESCVSENSSGILSEEFVNTQTKLVSKLEKKNVLLEQELEFALKAKQEVDHQVSVFKATTEKLEAKLKQKEKECLSASSRDKADQLSNSTKKYQKELENKYIIIAEMQKKITELTQTNSELKKKVQDFEKDLQLHIDAKNSIDIKFKELESKVSSMAKESSEENSSSEADQPDAKQISWVKKAQNSNERRESMLLTSDLKQENEFLKSKNNQQTEEINKIKAELKEVRELKKQLKEKETSLDEAKLDLRAAQRKEEQSQSVTSMLRERNKELREKLKESEEMVTSKTRIEDDFKEKINALEDDITRLKDEITQIEKSKEIEKAKLEERIKTLKDTWENSKDMNQKFAKTQGQYEEILRQNSELVKDNDEKERKVNEYVQENKTLKAELAKRKEACAKLQKVNDALKEACRGMEEDMDEMKIIIEERDSSIQEMEEDIENFHSEAKELKEKLKNSTKSIENMEKEKQDLLDHINQLTSELSSQTELHEAEVQDLSDSLTHFKRLVNELEVQISQLQRLLATRDGDAQGQAGKVLTLEGQLCHIKEEAARHITQISSLKTSNFKLTQELEDALNNQREAQRSIEEVYNELESEKAKHNHEKVKLKETISQQTKLIDFLQCKTENMEKKKTPMSRLFGKKENVPPTQSMPAKDVEKMLETERSRNRRLQDQLSQARVEREMMRKEISTLKKSASNSGQAEIPVSPRSRAMHSALMSSPSNQNSKELLKSLIKPPGMKHKIPHRFAEVLCMRSTKCCACLDSIHFGRQMGKCQECSITCHPKCSTSLPSTCGLPSEYMKHFKNAIQDNTAGSSSDSSRGKSEGWIKVPKANKQGWDRRYLRLSDSVLYLFEDADQAADEDKAIVEFDFRCGGKAKMVVTGAVSATELPNVAVSDLPYVLKIELLPVTTCWPQRSLYIMTSNFNDKQMWVTVLEHLSEKNAPEVEEPQKTKLVGKTLWTLKSQRLIDPLCTTLFDQNVILMGAVEGLYVLNVVTKFSCSLREKIEGFSHVYQVKCMRNIGMVVFIHGEDRKLSLARLTDIQSNLYKKQASVPLKDVAGVNDCHLFAVEENESLTTPYICVAITDGVVVCRWDPKERDFVPKKRIQTKEPCSCILFTPQSVIFGADMFFELSLGDFNAKMFLDENDTSLAGLVYGALRFGSFPVAIFQVSLDKQNREYLICFHEIGVFVNSEGRRTRQEDMKWSRLPLSFAYQSPYLFITHFTSVEVVEVPPHNVPEHGNRAVLRLEKPHFMGLAHFPKSILVSSTVSGQTVELIAIDGTSIGQTDFNLTVSSDELGTEESTSSGKESIENSEVAELDFSFTTTGDENIADEDAVSIASYYSSESVGSSQTS